MLRKKSRVKKSLKNAYSAMIIGAEYKDLNRSYKFQSISNSLNNESILWDLGEED